MDITGNLREINGNVTERPKHKHRSYLFRVGQVERLLKVHSEVTICDLARLVEITPRQMWNICHRMAAEGRITVRQVPHRPNMFKHLISRP